MFVPSRWGPLCSMYKFTILLYTAASEQVASKNCVSIVFSVHCFEGVLFSVTLLFRVCVCVREREREKEIRERVQCTSVFIEKPAPTIVADRSKTLKGWRRGKKTWQEVKFRVAFRSKTFTRKAIIKRKNPICSVRYSVVKKDRRRRWLVSYKKAIKSRGSGRRGLLPNQLSIASCVHAIWHWCCVILNTKSNPGSVVFWRQPFTERSIWRISVSVVSIDHLKVSCSFIGSNKTFGASPVPWTYCHPPPSRMTEQPGSEWFGIRSQLLSLPPRNLLRSYESGIDWCACLGCNQCCRNRILVILTIAIFVFIRSVLVILFGWQVTSLCEKRIEQDVKNCFLCGVERSLQLFYSCFRNRECWWDRSNWAIITSWVQSDPRTVNPWLYRARFVICCCGADTGWVHK